MAKATQTTTPKAAETAPKKGGGLTIVLIIIGILCILCAGATVVGVILVNRAKKSADDTLQEGLQNLFENGLENAIEDGIEGNLDGDNGDTDVSFDGELPSDFPSDVPVYPGAEPGLSSSTDDESGKSIWVSFTSDDSADDINAFYEDELVAEGWDITSKTEFLGFTITAEAGGRTVTIYVSDNDDGTSYLTISITGE